MKCKYEYTPGTCIPKNTCMVYKCVGYENCDLFEEDEEDQP